MIIERYLLREVCYTFIAVSVLLMLIFLSGTFVRILAETLEGVYPASVMLTIFGLKGVGNLVFIMPLSFFFAVLLALGRLYKDSEMTALIACGVGPGRILISVGGLSVIVAVLVGLLALWFAPWAEDKSSQLLDEVGARSGIENIAAGRFNQLGHGGLLVYVESIDVERKKLNHVFVSGREDGRQHILTADKAYQKKDPATGDRFLVMVDGYRYQGMPGAPDFKIISFKEHGVRIEEKEIIASRRPRHAVPTMKLWQSRDPGDAAELQWRIAMPISTVLLALLAIPLSKTSPRQGRYGNLFAGIMLYIIYNNLLTMARSSLGKGEVSPEIGLWWVHGLLAVLLIVIFQRQKKLPGPRRQWRRSTA